MKLLKWKIDKYTHEQSQMYADTLRQLDFGAPAVKKLKHIYSLFLTKD